MVGRSIDAERAHALDVVGVLDAGLLHRLAGALDGAPDASLADEHVMRFLRQHEAAGARERIEAGLRERLQLHLAVAVGEVGEHEERQPVRRLLVEGAEHARRLLRAGAAAQQIVGLVAPVGAEIFVQQIDHRPEMAAFLDIDLKQVAHVVERGRGQCPGSAAARPRPARCRPGSRSAGASARDIRRAPPATPFRPRARRRECAGPRHAAPAGCPSDIPAS